VAEFPQKETYRLSEVCRYTDTQPYVLRFWESEFPQLNPERSGSGQPVYRKEDIDLVRRIKQLLYEEECSLEVARQALENDKYAAGRKKRSRQADTTSSSGPSSSAARKLQSDPAGSAQARTTAVVAPERHEPGSDSVSRQRYENAVEEVHHLRLQLRDSEKARRRAEESLQDAIDEGERYRTKAARAAERIEELLERLS